MPALNLDNMFRHHELDYEQYSRAEGLRRYALQFAQAIQLHAPEGANQTLALRHVEDALMRATKAIAEDYKPQEKS